MKQLTTANSESSHGGFAGRVAFIDLVSQRARLAAKIDAAISSVLDGCHFTSGPQIAVLEKGLAEWSGAEHVVTCSSGTDALLLVLMAMEVGPGDAVICPSFTFAATAEVVARLGATPVFVDVDPASFNMDSESLSSGISTARASGLRPRGAIPVDLFGQPADYDGLRAVADSEGVWLLADAAQSFGSTYKGRPAGSLALATATSFYPTKPLGCYGDGGAVFTQDGELAARIRSLREHGKGIDRYDNVRIGLTGRLDTIQAAVLLEKLWIFADELRARRAVAARYARALEGFAGLPRIGSQTESSWAQYTVRVDESRRDEIAARLKLDGVDTAIYYGRPLHLQTAFRHFPSAPGGAPESEIAAREVLSLPIHPYLTEAAQDFVVERLKAAIGRG